MERPLTQQTHTTSRRPAAPIPTPTPTDEWDRIGANHNEILLPHRS